MNPSQAKSTLLVRAVELADATGVLLPQAVRDDCTRAAGPPEPVAGPAAAGERELTPGEEAYLARRAALLEAELGERAPGLLPVTDASGLRGWVGAALLALAFVAGFLAYEIAPGERINLLAFPLPALILWNLAVYLLLLLRRLRPRGEPREPGPLAGTLARWLARAGLPRPPAAGSNEAGAAIAAKAASRFLGAWVPLQAPLALARARTLFHAGAMLLALGAAAGLLFRGLYLEYLAGWESTFLDAGTVRAVLALLLGPAVLATGIGIPDGPAFEALRFRPGFDGVNAADWIRLYVVAAGLYVMLPRALLAAASALAERRLRRGFYRPSCGDRYFHRLLQANRGGGEVAAVLWHGIDPTPERRARVREALADALGGRVTLEFLDAFAYGEEEAALAALSAREPREHSVAVFSLAATPEEEVHGALLSRLASRALPGEERAPLVLLDAAPLARFLPDAGFRTHYDDRLQSWKRFLAAHRATLIVLAPEGVPASPA